MLAWYLEVAGALGVAQAIVGGAGVPPPISPPDSRGELQLLHLGEGFL